MSRDDAVRAAAEALAAHDVKGHSSAARLAAARLAVDAAAPHLTADLVRERDEARAEVERLSQGGAALGIAWPIDRLAPDGVPWLDHYNAEVARRGEALARGEAAEAEVKRLRELWADTHREKRELTAIVVRQRDAIARVEAVLAHHWDWKAGRSLYSAVRAALRGDA